MPNTGWAGKVTEADYALAWGLGGADAVRDDAAWKVVPGSGRAVSVDATGAAFARGVLSTGLGTLTATLGTPTNGQWYLIVRRIAWVARTVTLVAIPHTVTATTTTPTLPPTGLPTVFDNPGVNYDQPLAWAFVNSANTTVTIFDLRRLAVTSRLARLETPTIVGSAAERDFYYPAPVQGQTVFRSDLGFVERYANAFVTGTNPGGMGTAAGWYPNGVPIIGIATYGAFAIGNASPTGLSGLTPTFDTANSSAVAPLMFQIVAGGLRVKQPGTYMLEFHGSYDAAIGGRAFVDLGFVTGPGMEPARRSSFTADETMHGRTITARTRNVDASVVPVLFQASGAGRNVAAGSTLRLTYLGPVA